MKMKMKNIVGFSGALRLQLNPAVGFTFKEAEALIPYMVEMGYTWLYLSPVWTAVPGSTHFYNVINPNRISDELGGWEAFKSLCRTAKRCGINVMLDWVPNHMAVHELNKFWADGREQFFDVEPGTGVYRRFLDIGELAALKQTSGEVFKATHKLLFHLVERGFVQAIRVDHPDGLEDPYGYAQKLTSISRLPVFWEKVHRPNRNVPACVKGVVGYGWLADVEHLFGSKAGRAAMLRVYRELTGETRSFAEFYAEAKLQAAKFNYKQDAERLHRLLGIEEVSVDDISFALAQLDDRTFTDIARRRVQKIDRKAIERSSMHPRLKKVLLLEEPGHDSFVKLFEVIVAGVVARGEYTAHFRYTGLLGRCEHAVWPTAESLSVDGFHARNLYRLGRYPMGLNTATTHDAYRSADARAFLDGLSLHGREWGAKVAEWRLINQPLRQGDAARIAVDDELRIYQTLLSGEYDCQAVVDYIIKAVREAGINSNWWNPGELNEYEQGLKQFIEALYTYEPFQTSFRPFAAKVAESGRAIAVSEMVLRLLTPGMADIYQGEDLWLWHLLDPHNRRPVDWDVRRRILADFKAGAKPTVETVKMWVLWKLLNLRKANEAAFMGAGSYTPIEAGKKLVAFERAGVCRVYVGLQPAVSIPPAEEGWCNLLQDVTDLGFAVAVYVPASTPNQA